MKSFFVTFGKGILYFLGLPFMIAFLAIYGIYMLVLFFIMAFKSIVLFFQGKETGVKDELDEKALNILRERKRNAILNKANAVTNVNNQNTINQTINNYNLSNQGLPSTPTSNLTQNEVPLVEGIRKVEPITVNEPVEDKTNNLMEEPRD